MRAVKTNAFLWAAMVVIIGLDERLAFPAAIVGLLLAVVPMIFAPKLVPTQNHEQGHHAGTLYRLAHPGQPVAPAMPQPETRAYVNGSGS
jgi:hypothetical protein